MTPTGIAPAARIAALAVTGFWAALAADAVAQDGAASDRAALEAIYDATDGASWTDGTNWKTAAPLDTWYGVTTGPNGRVTRLELDENGLTGSLPPALGSLANLERLSLAENELTGPMPGELGNLANLELLYVWQNELTGRVPAWLGNLTRLRWLSLGGNELTGPIPDELGNLANLEVLHLERNELTGPVPAWLGNLTGLRRLSLGGNELTGPIPDELRNLTQLEWLYLWGNELTGPVPGWLGNLTRLQRLSLSWNALTGPIPSALGNLTNLEQLVLSGNELTGPVPAWLGNLTRLRELWLKSNALTGRVPGELGSLPDLELLDVSYNWGLSGPLPPELRPTTVEELDIFATPLCAPAAWQDRLETIVFYGRLCEAATDATIDVAVVYTPAARAGAGGGSTIEAVIDLMVAEANRAYAASGVAHRVTLVERSEVTYTEAGDSQVDLRRLRNPSDGHMDEVHALRDRVGADLVHLIVSETETDFCGRAGVQGPFGVTGQRCGGRTFAHELGHNMGLWHDRYRVQRHESGPYSHPAYGYVNQRGLLPSASPSSRWRTIMSYPAQCDDDGLVCSQLLRFSNPRQTRNGDPLGVAHGAGGSGLTGPADAAAVIDATGPAVALWRKRPSDDANRPPALVGTLPDRTLPAPPGMLAVDVSQAFADPDGDALTYTVSSSAPHVVTMAVAGARVTLTSVAEGRATIGVTATDPGGLSATGSFTATVPAAPVNRPPTLVGTLPDRPLPAPPGVLAVDVSQAFADPDGDVLTYTVSSSAPGVARAVAAGARVTFTSVGAGTATIGVTATDPGSLSAAGSFTVRVAVPGTFTDEPIRPGVTPVRAVHLTELRTRIDARRRQAELEPFAWTDPVLTVGVTPVRLAHLLDLREALAAAYARAGRPAPVWTDPAPAAGTALIRAAHLTELRAAVLALE